MYDTRNDLAPELRGRMVELLNGRLADAIDVDVVVAAALHFHETHESLQKRTNHRGTENTELRHAEKNKIERK